MTVFFVDTSALAKRYLSERGSAWVRTWMAPEARHTIAVSSVASVEMASLLARRSREATLQRPVADALFFSFKQHENAEYFVTPLNGEVLTHAAALTLVYPLRALDALQLASALHLRAVSGFEVQFVTSDRVLRQAAAQEGFPTDDPLDHLAEQ